MTTHVEITMNQDLRLPADVLVVCSRLPELNLSTVHTQEIGLLKATTGSIPEHCISREYMTVKAQDLAC